MSPETAVSVEQRQDVLLRILKECSLLTVNSNAYEIAKCLYFASCQVLWSEIPDDEMAICTICYKLVSVSFESLCKRMRVDDDLLRINLPLGLTDLKEGGRNGSDSLQPFVNKVSLTTIRCWTSYMIVRPVLANW